MIIITRAQRNVSTFYSGLVLLYRECFYNIKIFLSTAVQRQEIDKLQRELFLKDRVGCYLQLSLSFGRIISNLLEGVILIFEKDKDSLLCFSDKQSFVVILL